MRGAFINLDRSSERHRSLQARLAEAGLPASDYLRIAGIEPCGDEPQLQKGLRSKGELGIWRSLITTFNTIAGADFSDVVHVLEDDAAFPDGIAGVISNLSQLMLSTPNLADTDIIFLDYLLTRDLFAHVIARRAALAPAGMELMPASQAYLACCGSFLIRRSSAAYLSGLLGRILESADQLSAVDLTLRSLLRLGAVKGYILVPPAGASSWEDDQVSSVQSQAEGDTRRRQRAYLLLKLLASGLQSPFWCAERLSELYQTSHPLTRSGSAFDFLAFFDSLRPRIGAF